MKPCRDGAVIVGDEQETQKKLSRKTLSFVASEMRKANIHQEFRKTVMGFLQRK